MMLLLARRALRITPPDRQRSSAPNRDHKGADSLPPRRTRNGARTNLFLRSLTIATLTIATLTAQSDADRKPDRIISITAERFNFRPSKITVKQGELIE